MSNIAIMTDSNSGILPEQGEKEGIAILPMPVVIEGKTYYEEVDLSKERFYQLQKEGAQISTSMPSPGSMVDMWKTLLQDHDEVVYIPMSSGLSNSCHSAIMLAQEFQGKVFVVDNHRVSVTLTQSVYDALAMAKAGMNGAQIKEKLEQESDYASIYIAVDTLEYLKKGGRITPAAASIGTVLNLKPVLSLAGGDKLDSYAKVRGMKHAFHTMCEALRKDIDGKFSGYKEKCELMLGFADSLMDEEKRDAWKAELQKNFPDMEILYSPLTLSLATHIGPGAVGVAVFHR